MDFRIADTFTTALTRLPAQEQKAVKVSVLDLQLDPSAQTRGCLYGALGPGTVLHGADRRSEEPGWWGRDSCWIDRETI